MIAEQALWKVGELAKRTGITVRTLHHYDQVGLLSPSRHTDAGHRLYTKDDIARLQQIISLKQLDFSLDDIKAFMDNPNCDPSAAIRLQLERLNAQIQVQERLRDRLEEINALMSREQDVSAEKLIEVIEVTNMTKNYFTKEQLDQLKEREERLGKERIEAVQNEWPELIAQVRGHMEKRTPASDPDVIALAKRWRELVEMFSGGDKAIESSVATMYRENPDRAAQYGIDGDIFRYVQEAMAHI